MVCYGMERINTDKENYFTWIEFCELNNSNYKVIKQGGFKE
jgi:hypothetical protein